MTPQEINQAITKWAGRKRDYYHDLNAVHEAEKLLFKLNDWSACDYEERLQKLTTSWAWHATAPQRCEALLKTLKLWKE